MTGTPFFDYAVIGSSPLSLAYAAIKARQGKKICVVDRNPSLGGAWAVEDALGFKSIETSPHVFIPHPKGFDVLNDVLDSRFVELSSDAILEWRTGPQHRMLRSVSVSDVRGYRRLMERAYLREASWYEPASWIKRLYRLARSQMQGSGDGIVHCPTMYPQGGLIGMFDRAETRLLASGAAVLKQSQVSGIDVDHGKTRVRLKDGRTVECATAVLNKHVDFDGIAANAELHPFHKRSKRSQHFAFVVDRAEQRAFRQFCGSFPLIFANDVTEYCPDFQLRGKPGSRLFCARANKDESFTLMDVVSVLKAIGYLPEDSAILDGRAEIRDVAKIQPGSIAEISARFAPNIQFLLSDDLGLMDSLAALT